MCLYSFPLLHHTVRALQLVRTRLQADKSGELRQYHGELDGLRKSCCFCSIPSSCTTAPFANGAHLTRLEILIGTDNKLGTNFALLLSSFVIGMIDCCRKAIEKNGVFGLYRGIGPNFLKSVPSISISYAVFETVSSRLQYSV